MRHKSHINSHAYAITKPWTLHTRPLVIQIALHCISLYPHLPCKHWAYLKPSSIQPTTRARSPISRRPLSLCLSDLWDKHPTKTYKTNHDLGQHQTTDQPWLWLKMVQFKDTRNVVWQNPRHFFKYTAWKWQRKFLSGSIMILNMYLIYATICLTVHPILT